MCFECGIFFFPQQNGQSTTMEKSKILIILFQSEEKQTHRQLDTLYQISSGFPEIERYTNSISGMRFFKIYFIHYTITAVLIFPFVSLSPAPPSLQQSPLQFISMGHAYKFFHFPISYTILNTLLSILYLSIMLLSPCTIFPIHPFPLPGDNPPNDLHIYESVLVLIVCLISFFSFSC